jgi:hypothetical protein
MDTNQVTEHLQVIRTLMERSALYRRALAPIMLFAGIVGIVTAAVGLALHLESPRAFGALWLGTAVVVIAGAFIIARRQAIQDKEDFWSPPTRRVTQALLPQLTAGLILGVMFTQFRVSRVVDFTLLLPFLWAILYGCAMHSAGFFVHRGIRLFGWILVGISCSSLIVLVETDFDLDAHWLMGFFFGVLHLAYGIYLFATEKRDQVS